MKKFLEVLGNQKIDQKVYKMLILEIVKDQILLFHNFNNEYNINLKNI